MKNLKKISLISFLACATLAGGILAANTEVETPVQEQRFWMETGAQIRVPDAVEEGAEDFDGIRFIAKMTDAYRVEKGELENMSVGMFFLPANKVDTINEAAVFGENATYYWDGCGYEKGDRLEIVHKETYAFEETKGDDFLTIKCSLWNLLPETLDREIGAVAYLRVNVGTDENPVYEYHFAETAQGARAVSVAQKALLNTKDEIHTVEGGADRVNAAYVNAYLESKGGSVEVDYVETVYKQQKDLTYELVEESVTKTATVTAYNTKVPAGVEHYTLADGWVKQDRTLLFDGSTVVDSYYNYSANRVTIWDGDTADSYDSTYLKWYSSKPDEYQTPMVKVDGKYEGNALRLYGTRGFDGPHWTNSLKLPAASNTLNMYVEVEDGKGYATHGYQPNFNSFYLYYGGTKAVSMRPIEYKIVNLDTMETTVVDYNYDSSLGYENETSYNLLTGRYNITMVFPNTFDMITCLCFHVYQEEPAATSPSGTREVYPVMYADNITAVIQTVTSVSVPYTYTDSITIKASGVIDTTVWDGEESDYVPDMTVSYKQVGASEYSSVDAENGVYTIPTETDSTKYEVLVSLDGVDTTYTIVKGQLWGTFDDAYADRKLFYSSQYTVANIAKLTNDYAWTAHENAGHRYIWANVSWVYFANKGGTTFGAEQGYEGTTLGCWVYAPKEVTISNGYFWMSNNSANFGSRTIPAGYSYVEFTFSKSLKDTFHIGINAGKGEFYVNAIALI